MKVLYLAHSDHMQGSGFALLHILRGMLAADVEPVVVLPGRGELTRRLEQMGIRCYCFPYHNAVYPRLERPSDPLLYLPRLLRTLICNRRARRSFEKVAEAERPDLIHTNVGTVHFGSTVAARRGIPHVWHLREYQILDFGYKPIGGMKRFRRLLAASNNGCIAITRGVFDYFRLDSGRDRVIYDGVFDGQTPSPEPEPEASSYLLFVGALEKGKGVYDALDAFSRIAPAYPRIELWLAGNDYIGIRSVVDRYDCKDRIRYLGFRTDVYSLMAGARALLVPSYSEGFGFITVEAMFNRCLVVGRDTAGTKEQFDNGLQFCGEEIALRFRSQEEFADRLREVCSHDKSRFRPMTENACRTVRALYTTERNAENILLFYRSLVNRKQK